MSVATKRKWVRKEVLEDFSLPTSEQTIVRIIRNAGNNLHEVETATSDLFLASLPTKFRQTCWIKRGDFVITEPIQEGDKVKGEIVRILYQEHIKVIHEADLWPAQFAELVLKKYKIGKKRMDGYYGTEVIDNSKDDVSIPSNPNESLVNYGNFEDDCESSSDLDDIPANPNLRPAIYDEYDSDDTSTDEEEEDYEGEEENPKDTDVTDSLKKIDIK